MRDIYLFRSDAKSMRDMLPSSFENRLHSCSKVRYFARSRASLPESASDSTTRITYASDK